jgi:FtsP/CotA-like multicopper oxidase with cupredoxin domain
MQRKGRKSVVRFINRLAVPSSTHLHGMATVPQYDGWANDLIPPQYYKDYVYPNNRAASIWYHDHAVMNTARNVYMGLAGWYIIQDETELKLKLPSGKYDVPLMLQDRIFDRTGQPVFDASGLGFFMGDVILVNGVPWPRMNVEPRKYRFRIVNASSARTYRLRLSNGHPFILIGTDAGLINAPLPISEFRIGPGERYEFILDFGRYPIGTQIVLQNLSLPDNVDYDRTNVVMRFDVTRKSSSGTTSIPKKLRTYNPIPAAAAVRTRTWDFNRDQGVWVLNGRTWNPNRMDAEVNLNDIEIWRFTHFNPTFHTAHIHLVDAQLLSRNGQPPLPYERGWKDTFFLGPFEEISVITKFGPHLGKYMFHCHITTHEDNDMMVGWEIVRRDASGAVIQRGSEPTSDPAKPFVGAPRL